MDKKSYIPPSIVIEDGGLPGVRILRSRQLADRRGTFTKVHHRDYFFDHHMDVAWAETYWTSSRKNVIRGMHFQSPPFDHDKLVACQTGEILDVLVDLRSGPNYGRTWSVTLSPGNGLFIPRGLAHGFRALTDDVLLLYQVSSIYHPNHDRGIRWDSVGFSWGVEAPIVSDRDMALPKLVDLDCMFS